MDLAEIHARLGNASLLYVLFIGLWGLFRYFRKQGVSSSYFGVLAIAEILIIVHGLLGAVLYFGGARPERSIHILYGIVSALVIPGIFAYTQGDNQRRVQLIYGVALLILAALIFRAISTAGPAG
jgi:hypothetical protein